MARLILINGLPASGKSTIARRYVDENTLALALDVDVVRSMLGRWLDQPGQAGLAARRIAIGMARVHLQAGHDVVVPQFLGHTAFIVTMEQLAADVDALFIEVTLLTSAAGSEVRFLRRSSGPSRPEHLDAARLLEKSGGPGQLADMHARLSDVVARRPRTHTVVTIAGAIDDAYRDFSNVIDNA